MSDADRSSVHRPVLRGSLDLLLGVGDLLSVLVAAGVALLTVSTLSGAGFGTSVGELLVCALLCFVLFPVYRGWRSRSLLQDLGVLLLAWSASFVLLAGHAISVGAATRLLDRWLLSCYLFGWVGMVILRTLLRLQIHRWNTLGRGHERVILVGLNAPALKLQRTLQRQPSIGKSIIGYFAAHSDVQSSSDSMPLCLGRMEELPVWLAQHHAQVDQVWVSLAVGDSAAVKNMLRRIEPYPLQVRLIPDTLGMGALNPGVLRVGDVAMIGVRQGVLASHMRIIKRIEDLLVAGTALLLLSPLLVLLALGVKLSSPGPVLFHQRRHGLGGKEFWMLKFRSMRVHQEQAGQVRQASRNDPRVTRFGAFLRRTSLDELPQFFNVLVGDMSVVGPRPHAVEHNTHYQRLIRRYMHRHYVKPGITGWAQVNGLRGETPDLRSMRRRVHYDIDYIRRWSPLMDMAIIVMTAFKVLWQKTAY